MLTLLYYIITLILYSEVRYHQSQAWTNKLWWTIEALGDCTSTKPAHNVLTHCSYYLWSLMQNLTISYPQWQKFRWNISGSRTAPKANSMVLLKHLTPQKLISIRQRFWVISKICKIVTIPATVKNPLKIPVGAAWFRSTPKSSLVLVSVTHPTLPKISSKFVTTFWIILRTDRQRQIEAEVRIKILKIRITRS